MSDLNNPTPGQRLDKILAEYLQGREAGTALNEAEVIARSPEFAEKLRDFFADIRSWEDWENEGGALTTGP